MSRRTTFTTRQIAGLAGLFDCLRHISPEVTLHATEDGIRIGELTGTNAMYINVLLEAARFETYEGGTSWVMRTGTTHVILGAMLRQMGSASRNGVLTMSHDAVKLPPTCVISLSSSSDDTMGSEMRYEVPCGTHSQAEIAQHLKDIADNETRMFSSTYVRCMYVSARHLSHLVSHVFPLGDRVDMSCTKDEVCFNVHNSFSMITRARVRFRTSAAIEAADPTTSLPAKRSKNTEQDGTTHVCYFMQPLIMMLARAMSLHATTAILLPDTREIPALMEATLADLGKLSIAIAQIGADSDGD